MFNFPLCKLYSNSLMSSLNARHGWKFESYGESSNIPSGNLEIVLSSNLQTSPLIPSSPTLALQNIGDWYDNFSIDGGGPFASHGHTVHSDISSMTIPVREPLSDFLFFSILMSSFKSPERCIWERVLSLMWSNQASTNCKMLLVVDRSSHVRQRWEHFPSMGRCLKESPADCKIKMTVKKFMKKLSS